MIKLFLTGGTIDKVYQPLDGSLGFDNSIVTQMLERARCTAAIETETLFLKDSLDTSEAERALIVQKCQQSKHRQIVLTHGTDTMVETAQKITSGLGDKTVVLTGAMVPYRIKNSDALFNLGAAISAVQCLAAGVYICMNGQIFLHNNVVKNKSIGQFTSIN